MEKIILIGNLTNDPELRHVDSVDKDVCNFSLAVNKGKDSTNFYRISVWGTYGQNCAKYLNKGSKVCVEGNDLVVQLYTKNDGSAGVALNLTATTVEFLNSKSENADNFTSSTTNRPSQPPRQPSKPTQKPQQKKSDYDDEDYGSYTGYDDMPF